MKRLEGKVALVTGANRGIGRGIALCLAEEGADIVINDRDRTDESEEVIGAIATIGRRALAWQADVADREQVLAMIKSVVKHFGELDIAVANPAYNLRQTFVEADWDTVHRVVAVTQLGAFHTCQFAAQQMLARGKGGKIILISSIHAEVPFARNSAYNMSKAAVNHLAFTMANELAPHHINVNVIEPGWIDTPGEREFSTEEDLRQGARRIPWGRLGTPRDIGRCAAFLASEDADYITGACLRVDGGYMVGLTLPQAVDA